MEKQQIEDYIKRLQQLESDMSGGEEDIDHDFIQDLDKLLKI